MMPGKNIEVMIEVQARSWQNERNVMRRDFMTEWTAETSIPYGNACDINITRSSALTTVSFMSDPHGGPESLWFCVRVHRQTAGEKTSSRAGVVRFVLKNCTNSLGCTDPRAIIPVARIDGRPWKRLEPGKRIEHVDGRIDGEWIVKGARQSIEIATCFPYGWPEVDRLVNDTNGVLKRDVIGVSQGARPLVRLSNSYGSSRKPTRGGVYVLARQHSGETPGSWVLDGMLRRLAQAGDRGPVVWALPLANVDGVEQGDYGKDNFPIDLNRAWGHPPLRHETLVIQKDMERWRHRCVPKLVLDLHAPAWGEDQGIYAFMSRGLMADDVRRPMMTWAQTLKESLGPKFAADAFDRVAGYNSHWNTPMVIEFAAQALHTPALALETPYSRIKGRVARIQDYQEAGRRLAEAIIMRVK